MGELIVDFITSCTATHRQRAGRVGGVLEGPEYPGWLGEQPDVIGDAAGHLSAKAA